MVYCEACRHRRHWPRSPERVAGLCETCGERKSDCHQLPRAIVPAPRVALINAGARVIVGMADAVEYVEKGWVLEGDGDDSSA